MTTIGNSALVTKCTNCDLYHEVPILKDCAKYGGFETLQEAAIGLGRPALEVFKNGEISDSAVTAQEPNWVPLTRTKDKYQRPVVKVVVSAGASVAKSFDQISTVTSLA